MKTNTNTPLPEQEADMPMKAISKDLESYFINRNGLGYTKSPAIWGNYKPNTIAPLVYLKKPKWVSDDDFDKILDALKLELIIMEDTNDTK